VSSPVLRSMEICFCGFFSLLVAAPMSLAFSEPLRWFFFVCPAQYLWVEPLFPQTAPLLTPSHQAQVAKPPVSPVRTARRLATPLTCIPLNLALLLLTLFTIPSVTYLLSLLFGFTHFCPGPIFPTASLAPVLEFLPHCSDPPLRLCPAV